MTEHIHAKLMMQYAQDAMESEAPWKNYQFQPIKGEWLECSKTPTWQYTTKYRRVDPYQKFRDAIANGGVVECLQNTGNWVSRSHWSFNDPIENYRIADPYREFKEALNEGKLVEGKQVNGNWYADDEWLFKMPPENYRIYDEHREMREAQANGALLECKQSDGTWKTGKDMQFVNEPEEYRVHDKYRELKEAEESGLIVQIQIGRDIWVRRDKQAAWTFGIDTYRIKPPVHSLQDTVQELYDAGTWVCDGLNQKYQTAIWTEVRDALKSNMWNDANDNPPHHTGHYCTPFHGKTMYTDGKWFKGYKEVKVRRWIELPNFKNGRSV